MKRFFITIFILFISLSSFSQRFIGSVIAGGNLTQVEGDEVFGFKKVGVNAGASVMLSLDEKQRFFFTIELLYTQKGSRERSRVDSMEYSGNIENINNEFSYNPKLKYKLALDYVEVPILFHYEDPHTGCAFGLGASWARLVRVSEVESGYRLLTNVRSKTYSSSDWGVIADVKIPIYKGLKINLRYQYSFIKIREREYSNTQNYDQWSRNQYNNVITLRLIYSFNEKFVKNNKKDHNGKRIGPLWIRESQF